MLKCMDSIYGISNIPKLIDWHTPIIFTGGGGGFELQALYNLC